MSTTALATDGSTTVKGYFNQLTDQYTREVVRGNLESTNKSLGVLVRHLMVEMERLWLQLGSLGAFSANDDLEEYSTTALEMLWTPYVIADLYQRAQTGAAAPTATAAGSSSAAGSGAYGSDTRMADHGRAGQGQGVAATTASANATSALELTTEQGAKAAQAASLAGLTRQECLSRSHEWFKRYFEWMENVGIVDEKTIATYAVYRADARMQRIELARTRNTLEQQWREAEGKVQYLRVKRRRMRELMEESGEALEEAGGEEEEALRERALVRLQWSFYDACHQMQLSTRELDMLGAIAPEQRAQISAEYQRTLDAVRKGELSLGKHTYTILPGGMMVQGTLDNPQPTDAEDVHRGGGMTQSEVLAAVASQQMFRQTVREDLQVDRNPPTMTLEAFAQKEMAEVQRQMMDAQRMQQEQAEEDARLGAEGVEDRQRKKDAAWDDWKEDHPAYGQTNKGNYS